MALWIFKKKVTLVNTNDKNERDAKEKLLKDAGIRTNSWATEEPPVLGGAHMKTSDWQTATDHNKDDQRITYHLEVAAEDQYRAMKILMGDSVLPEDFIK